MYRRSLILFLGLLFLSPSQSQTTVPWVGVGSEGKLVYHADAKGNRIPDFSRVGYRDGDVPLPEAPDIITLEAPADGFSDELIQGALDTVAKRPRDATGIRGAVHLRRGTYKLQGSLKISASGVVLRGDSDGRSGDGATTLIATQRKQHTLIQIAGKGQAEIVEGTRREIVDDYVPVGANTITLADSSPFTVGAQVMVRRASTEKWIKAIGMDRIPPRSDGTTQQWTPGSKDLLFERIVTKVEGNRLTLDAPICNALEKEFGPHTVAVMRFAGRIENVGVESLRCDSEYASPTDEQHGWDAISFSAVKDGWVRFVTSEHFGLGCVEILRTARNITVEDSICLDPISQITGGRRYPFQIAGQRNLVQRCVARNARHDFAMSSTATGPNVFTSCSATQSWADSGPHHRWSVGTLYDNLTITAAKGASGVGINLRNRGNMGTGHGWAGANQVVWNCSAPEMIIQNPPTAQNWVMGCITAKRSGNGITESAGKHVLPSSLYQAQLSERHRKVGR